jgi:hypothetical protein
MPIEPTLIKSPCVAITMMRLDGTILSRDSAEVVMHQLSEAEALGQPLS